MLQATAMERLVLDFMGFLYLAIILGFIQVIIVIVAVFGLCLYKHRLVAVVSPLVFSHVSTIVQRCCFLTYNNRVGNQNKRVLESRMF